MVVYPVGYIRESLASSTLLDLKSVGYLAETNLIQPPSVNLLVKGQLAVLVVLVEAPPQAVSGSLRRTDGFTAKPNSTSAYSQTNMVYQ